MLICSLALLTFSLGAPNATPSLDHVDASNQFRLVRVGLSWDVLTGEEADEADPGALAIWAKGSTTAFFSVEFGREIDLRQDVTSSLRQSFEPDEMESSGVQSLDFQGYPAAQETITTAIDGQRWTISALSYRKGDFVGRLWLEGKTARVGEDGTGFWPLIDALQILPGEIQPVIARSKDAFGTGWLLEDGVYRSALHGLQVEPKARWRVAAGPQLWKYRSRATVGLFTEQPTLAVTLTLHPAHQQLHGKGSLEDRGKTAPSHMVQAIELATGFQARRGFDRVPDSDRTVEFLGEPLELSEYRRPDDDEWRYLHGMGRRGPWLIELEGWSDAVHFPGFRESMVSAAASVSWMEPAARVKLQTRLRRGPDGDDTIGQWFACRGGTYTDFDVEFVVNKPDPSWTYLTREFAREWHKDCRFVARHAPTGVDCEIRATLMESSPDTDFRALHRSAAAEIFRVEDRPDEFPLGEDVRLGGITFRRTQRRSTLRASPPPTAGTGGKEVLVHQTHTVVLTGFHRGAFFSIVGTWTGGEEGGEAEALDALLDGISFPEAGVERAARTDDLYVQNAFGYRLARPGVEWEYGGSVFGDHPGPKFSRFLWESPGGIYLAVAAFDISDDPSAEAGLQRAIEVVRDSHGHSFTSRPGEFLGQRALLLEADGFLDHAIFAAFTRGRIVYVVGSHGHSGHMELDEVAKHFALMD